MEIVAIASVVIAITVIVLAGFMVPALIEMRKSALAVKALITDVESQLRPTLKELRELSSNLRILTEGIASKTDEVKSFMTAVGDTGRNISKINVAIAEVAGICYRSSLWVTGLKAAGRYVINRIIKKGR